MLSATCHRHAERAAVGLCVRCQTALCDECVTRLDGINHCVACLTALRRAPAKRARRDVMPLSRAAALFAVYGLVWVTLMLLFAVHGARG